MTDPPSRMVRIGNGAGFWGDSARGPLQLVRGGGIDYLTMDFLAEVTMSILQKMRARDPESGYATDFVSQLEQILPEASARGIRVIANAGGVNPGACARAVTEVVDRLGLDVTVATVTGDDVLPRLAELLDAGHDLCHLSTGEPLAPQADRVRSANAYLGAFPIAEALGRGADVVITGRVADASLTVAPLIHEFGWGSRDYDKLAAATVAGHIIECGPQCTGGNLDRWREVPDLDAIGYPIVEVEGDGSFVVTKKADTGGLVDLDSVTAQLLYEIGDPRRYLTPDVIADFTSIVLTPDGPDRVRVTGVRGEPPTDTLKVSVSIHQGWKVTGLLTVGGPDAPDKARATARILFARLKQAGVTFPEEDCLVELLGTNTLYPGMLGGPQSEPSEVVLRICVRAAERTGLDRFGAEIASLVTSGPPGLTGFSGGRPRASEVIGFWPALLARDVVPSVVTVGAPTGPANPRTAGVPA
ncbi:MAG: acyclic terpene utilization AtuA family protein [Lapillicoccus sp.]